MNDHSTTAAPDSPRLRRTPGILLRAAAAALARYRAWRRRRIAMKHLREFDEHLLKDIGISRSDIHRVTRTGRMPGRRGGC